MTAIEEMAGMDVLCCDKTGTLTLNSLSVDRNLIEVQSSTFASFFVFSVLLFLVFKCANPSAQVFADYMDKDTVLLLAGRASRLENQDPIDTAIVSMLADPREVSELSFTRLLVTFLEVLCYTLNKLFICRLVQTLKRFISCRSILWTNVLQ